MVNKNYMLPPSPSAEAKLLLDNPLHKSNSLGDVTNQKPTEKDTAWGGKKFVLDRRGLGRAGTCVYVIQSTSRGGSEMG